MKFEHNLSFFTFSLCTFLHNIQTIIHKHILSKPSHFPHHPNRCFRIHTILHSHITSY
ncbi:hypothetical protein HanRHA438_Chr08g0347641 [Helianthus annuus]|nr:hypothetical protein HanRHA438_Chr08g0347641 [Helianthus annuus]